MRAMIDALQFEVDLVDIENDTLLLVLTRYGPVPERAEQPTVIVLTGSGALQLIPREIGWREIESDAVLYITQPIRVVHQA